MHSELSGRSISVCDLRFHFRVSHGDSLMECRRCVNGN